MRRLWIDPIGGISGDMILGAFLSLDSSLETALNDFFSTLPVKLKVERKTIELSGIQASQVVLLSEHKDHEERNFSDIQKIIRASSLTPRAKDCAEKVFHALASAESEVHGLPLEKVHFHEVGAWDSIGDILGASFLWDALDAPSISLLSPLPLGSGTVSSRHGVLPLPAPAVTLLLRGFPVTRHGGEEQGERITPTGAAWIRALAEPEIFQGDLIMEKVAYGTGQRSFSSFPNLCRFILGSCPSPKRALIEARCTLDDMSPEIMSFVSESLYEAGVLEAFWMPAFAKKGRPAYLLTVLLEKARLDEVQKILFGQSTTFGFRYHSVQRRICDRKEIAVETPWGRIKAKLRIREGKKEIFPEFEACREVSLREKIPIREVYRAVFSLNDQG